MLSNVLFLHFVCSQKTVPFTFFYSSICRICTQFWTLSRPLSFVFNRNFFFIRDFGRPNDSFLYFCAHSIFPLKCLSFLYELLGIFHEVPGDVKFLYLKARYAINVSRNNAIYVVAIRNYQKLPPWNQNLKQDGEMAARITAANFCEH